MVMTKEPGVNGNGVGLVGRCPKCGGALKSEVEFTNEGGKDVVVSCWNCGREWPSGKAVIVAQDETPVVEGKAAADSRRVFTKVQRGRALAWPDEAIEWVLKLERDNPGLSRNAVGKLAAERSNLSFNSCLLFMRGQAVPPVSPVVVEPVMVPPVSPVVVEPVMVPPVSPVVMPGIAWAVNALLGVPGLRLTVRTDRGELVVQEDNKNR